ncbi:hypothetical protein GXW78_22845 [Roseomonas terrae]|jgi:uncharacterized membrane protein YccC|uniref:Integral membrane bound transporter domain-containing protein n=1 Tax=Neoroseomonas terrae TaxID=424799 RepID=A0ABS5EPI3_9PROT|nr:FUSC family protein [Neoroseomonas terrae]MBR0652512.1 hypothetical protein [Neoroseomonas terrae]
MGTWTARRGLATAAGVVGAVLAALLFSLPDPWWAAISAWVLAGPDRHLTLVKAGQRVVGTVLGLVIGLLAVGLSRDQPLLLLLFVFCVGAVGTYARHMAEAPYAWLLGAITATMVLVQAAASPAGLFEFALNRTAEILTGVASAALAALLILPATPGVAAATPPPPTPQQLRVVTLVGGLIGVVVLLLWSAFDLPQPLQMAISALVVLDRDLGTLSHRGRQRAIGCLLGGLYGLLAMGLADGSLMLWLGVLGLGIFLFSVLHQGGGPSAYIGTQGGLGVIVSLVVGPAPPASIVPVAERLIGVTLGVATLIVMSVVVMRALTPRPSAATG